MGNTVRIILTNFTTFVKILCNLSHFYNDLDRRCNNVHIWKNLQHSGSNRRPLDLEADALPLSYGALHSRIHETVKIIQLQAHTKFKIHNYIFSWMQSYLTLNPRVASSSPVLVKVFSYVNGIFSWFYNVCQDRCKNGADYTRSWHTL